MISVGRFGPARIISASLIQPYLQTFIMTPIGIPATLWQSDYFQSSTSTFMENGNQMTWVWGTPLLPDTDQIINNAMTEATLDMALPVTVGPVTIACSDQSGSQIDAVSITGIGVSTIWGVFIWGSALWGGTVANLQPYELQWHNVIVFARMYIAATGNSAQGMKIGALHMRYQMLKTWTNTAAAA